MAPHLARTLGRRRFQTRSHGSRHSRAMAYPPGTPLCWPRQAPRQRRWPRSKPSRHNRFGPSCKSDCMVSSRKTAKTFHIRLYDAHLDRLGRFSARSAAAVAPAGAEGMRPSRLCVFVMGHPTTTVSGDVGTVPGGKLPPLSLRAKCTGVPTTVGCVSSERMARLRRAIERSALVGVGREVCVRARDLIAVCHGWHWHCCDFLHVHELPSRVRGALTLDHRKYKNHIVFI